MAKRKIIWSNRAKIKRYEILKYYIDRNKSNTYSKKLNLRISKELRLLIKLIKYPDLGIKTDIEGVRGSIIENFILFYDFNETMIVVHYIWDSRQNPDELKIK
jgi:plasmid stabilization system protein ParE